jgi:hypothetical protein
MIYFGVLVQFTSHLVHSTGFSNTSPRSLLISYLLLLIACIVALCLAMSVGPLVGPSVRPSGVTSFKECKMLEVHVLIIG